MLISQGDLLVKLKLLWPNVYVLLPDKMYQLCTDKWLHEVLGGTHLEKYRYKPEIFDCDDFALILNGRVKQEQYYENPVAPYAFGEILGDFVGITQHARNIVMMENRGLYVIEPQNDELRPASSDDRPFFVRM